MSQGGIRKSTTVGFIYFKVSEQHKSDIKGYFLALKISVTTDLRLFSLTEYFRP
jgi:hypothetical protein